MTTFGKNSSKRLKKSSPYFFRDDMGDNIPRGEIPTHSKCSIGLLILGFTLFLTGFVTPLWNTFKERPYFHPFPLYSIGLWTYCYYIQRSFRCAFYSGIITTAIRACEIMALIGYSVALFCMAMLLRGPKKSLFLVMIASEITAVILALTAVSMWPALLPAFSLDLSWSYWFTVLSSAVTIIATGVHYQQMKSANITVRTPPA